jgi:hypothetical protein
MDFTGRPMTGYVFVSAAGTRTVIAVRKWVDRGAEFVATLAESEHRPGAPAKE